MLENSLLESKGQTKHANRLAVVCSAAAHAVTLAVVALVPLVHTHAITTPAIDLTLWAPRTQAPRIREVTSAPTRAAAGPLSSDRSGLTAPDVIPDRIASLDTPQAPDFTLPVSQGIGNAGSLLRSLLHHQPGNNPAPPSFQPPGPAMPAPPPPPPAPVEAKPVRIGTMEKADLIHQVKPEYPPLARQARVQGVVVLEAVIGTDGAIRNLRVVSGHTLLAKAALDAVKQWKYKPTILSGEPVEVVTTITVDFTFQ